MRCSLARSVHDKLQLEKRDLRSYAGNPLLREIDRAGMMLQHPELHVVKVRACYDAVLVKWWAFDISAVASRDLQAPLFVLQQKRPAVVKCKLGV